MNTKDGETPLILAVSRDHARIVDLLIKNGANINATDKDGDTSLHVALMRHATLTNPLVQLLISVSICLVHLYVQKCYDFMLPVAYIICQNIIVT